MIFLFYSVVCCLLEVTAAALIRLIFVTLIQNEMERESKATQQGIVNTTSHHKKQLESILRYSEDNIIQHNINITNHDSLQYDTT